MRTFPVMLNLVGRLGVVVGSGPVAMRKAHALLVAAAKVRLVSPNPPADLDETIEILPEPYQPGHLEGACIVFACTNDREVNSRIASDARRQGALVCAVDQPDDCDFFSPAVAGDEDVIVAVGTGGAAPHLAKRLAKKIQAALPEKIGSFAACVAALRNELQTSSLPDGRRREILRELTSQESYHAFLIQGSEGVRIRCENWLRSEGGASCDSCA